MKKLLTAFLCGAAVLLSAETLKEWCEQISCDQLAKAMKMYGYKSADESVSLDDIIREAENGSC